MHLKNTHLYGIHNNSTHVIQDEEKTKWKKKHDEFSQYEESCTFFFLYISFSESS